MADSLIGKKGKVTIGANVVAGVGTWSVPGVSKAVLDDTDFGDNWSKFILGVATGGTVTFSGNRKLTDTTGQTAIMEAFDAETPLNTLRLYFNNTSYLEPCRTTGYLHPGKTTGANTEPANLYITAAPEGTNKGGLATMSFTAQLSGGPMVLV